MDTDKKMTTVIVSVIMCFLATYVAIVAMH